MGKTKTAFVSETEEVKKKGHEEEKNPHISGLKGGQRIKVVEAEAPAEEPKAEEKNETKKKFEEGIRSKRYQEAKAKIDREKYYKLEDAIKAVKEVSYSKFDGTMELHIMVKKVGASAQVNLPHSAGREKKVEIANDATIEKLKTGKIDFDVLVTTPDMMPKLIPFARLLGPKGLMPSPKNGTLITDPKKLGSFSAATVNLKTEKEAPLIHTVIGKNSQADKEIAENVQAILKALGGSRQIVKVYMKSSMSPSVKLQIA